jgi:hypothetical protein
MTGSFEMYRIPHYEGAATGTEQLHLCFERTTSMSFGKPPSTAQWGCTVYARPTGLSRRARVACARRQRAGGTAVAAAALAAAAAAVGGAVE